MSAPIDDGGAAFPAYNCQHSGMTMREYYAGQALAGLLASRVRVDTSGNYASDAVALADALIAALKEPS